VKKIVPVFILCLVWLAPGFGQRVSAPDFAGKWREDSLGTNGFRERAIVWDSIQNTYLINGMNMLHLKKKEILRLLGEPDFYGMAVYDISIIGGLTWSWNRTRVHQTLYYTFLTCNFRGYTTLNSVSIELRNNKVFWIMKINPCQITN
jgi:hypothetical protein